MQMLKMGKEIMRERIQEALATGDEGTIRRRLEVCLFGLDKAREGARLANELIDELGLEQWGQAKRPL